MNRMHPSSPHERHDAVVIDGSPTLVFVRQWLRDPARMAAIFPSGRHLARVMAEQLPEPCSRVVEVGAGTGAFTHALLEHGVAPDYLLVVEINRALARILRERFPDTQVACADARRLEVLAREHGMLDDGPVDAVVSGLGLLTMSSQLRVDILRAAFAVLGPAGRFVQFTYGPFSPLPRRERELLGLRVRRAGVVLRNLPPSSVFIYERLEAPGGLPHA